MNKLFLQNIHDINHNGKIYLLFYRSIILFYTQYPSTKDLNIKKIIEAGKDRGEDVIELAFIQE